MNKDDTFAAGSFHCIVWRQFYAAAITGLLGGRDSTNKTTNTMNMINQAAELADIAMCRWEDRLQTPSSSITPPDSQTSPDRSTEESSP